MKKMKNKVVVITGGSQGLGAEVARGLAKEGARVALVARREKWLKKTESEILLDKGEVKAFACDICKVGEVKQTVSKIIDLWGGVDVLVNNAGVWTDDSLEKMMK